MPINIRQLAIVLAVMLAACVLSGCSTINSSLAGTGEVLPQWLGGMPPDVPPRPGTAKYDEYMKEQERKRLDTGAAERGSGPNPITLCGAGAGSLTSWP